MIRRNGWPLVFLLAIAPALVSGQRIRLDADTVVPVTLEDELNLRVNRPGDTFTATVTERGADLPRGTRFLGRVVHVERARDGRRGGMELEFTELRLPDGGRTGIRAVPINWNDRNARRRGDGRIQSGGRGGRGEDYVLGGIVGGTVLGSILRKPFEGAMVGAIAGILMSEGNKNRASSGDVVARKGSKLGALIERDVVLNVGDRDWDRRDDRRWDDRGDDDRRDDGSVWEPGRELPGDDSAIRVWYGDRELRFSDREAPYRAGDTVMVPLERTARQLDLEVERVGDRFFYVEDNDSSIKFEQDSNLYRLNGRRAELSRPAVLRDRILYVPLEALAKVREGKLRSSATNW